MIIAKRHEVSILDSTWRSEEGPFQVARTGTEMAAVGTGQEILLKGMVWVDSV